MVTQISQKLEALGGGGSLVIAMGNEHRFYQMWRWPESLAGIDMVGRTPMALSVCSLAHCAESPGPGSHLPRSESGKAE